MNLIPKKEGTAVVIAVFLFIAFSLFIIPSVNAQEQAPPCGIGTTTSSVSCNGPSPSVTLVWDYPWDAYGHNWCDRYSLYILANGVRIVDGGVGVVWVAEDPAGQYSLCRGSYIWNGAASNTNYNYAIHFKIWWPGFGWDYILHASGSFTTPNCASYCGNGICGDPSWETCSSCPQDCGSCYIDIGLRVYDGTATIRVAAEPLGTLTSPLRISKNGNTYGVVLVDPSDPSASKTRIQTTSGTKALRKLD